MQAKQYCFSILIKILVELKLLINNSDFSFFLQYTKREKILYSYYLTI